MFTIDRLKLRLGVDDISEGLLQELLDAAQDIIFEHRFPYSEYPDKVERRYEGLQIQIATELYSKMGAEGQVGHSENGISRSWQSADVSDALLSRITPIAKVVKHDA